MECVHGDAVLDTSVIPRLPHLPPNVLNICRRFVVPQIVIEEVQRHALEVSRRLSSLAIAALPSNVSSERDLLELVKRSFGNSGNYVAELVHTLIDLCRESGQRLCRLINRYVSDMRECLERARWHQQQGRRSEYEMEVGNAIAELNEILYYAYTYTSDLVKLMGAHCGKPVEVICYKRCDRYRGEFDKAIFCHCALCSEHEGLSFVLTHDSDFVKNKERWLSELEAELSLRVGDVGVLHVPQTPRANPTLHIFDSRCRSWTVRSI